MNRGGNDDADTEREEADDDGQGGGLSFHQLTPEMVRRYLVNNHEAHCEEDHAEEGEENGVEDDLPVHSGYLWLKARVGPIMRKGAPTVWPRLHPRVFARARYTIEPRQS